MSKKTKTATLLALVSILIVLGTALLRESAVDLHIPLDVAAVRTDPAPEVSSNIEDPSQRQLLAVMGTGAYSAPAGRTLEFTYQASFATEMKHELGNRAARATQSCAGKLQITVVGRRDRELLLDVSFPDSTGSVVNSGCAGSLDHVCRELGGVFGIRMADDGRVAGYRFGQCATETRQLVRALISALHFVVPEGASERWETEEADATGTFRGRYEDRGTKADHRRIERTKLAYTKAGPEDAQIRTNGTSNGVLDSTAGWMRAVGVDESLTMQAPGTGLTISYLAKARFELVSWADAPVANPIAQGWDDSKEDAASGRLDVDPLTETGEEVSNVNVNFVLAELQRLASIEKGLNQHNGTAMMNTLAALVRARPEVLEALRAYALDEASELFAVQIVLAGIGSANTPAAQAFLVDALGTSALRDELRAAAATSTLALHKPNPAIMSALEHTAVDPNAPESVARTSLLMLGACSTRCDNRPEAMRQLLELEAKAKASGRLRTWLGALGNAGTVDVLAAATRYIQSKDRDLRFKAVKALRQIKDPRVGEALREIMKREASSTVRVLAAELLARQRDRASLKMVAMLLTADAPDVRLASIKGLARQRLSNPAAMRLIQDAARTSPDERVRKAALALLARS